MSMRFVRLAKFHVPGTSFFSRPILQAASFWSTHLGVVGVLNANCSAPWLQANSGLIYLVLIHNGVGVVEIASVFEHVTFGRENDTDVTRLTLLSRPYGQCHGS